MRDLETYGRMCEEDLAVIGLIPPKPIKYTISTRTSQRWGRCTTYKNKPYTVINISSFLLEDDCDENLLRNTLYHELCHAVDENKSGHKGRWLEYAELVNDCYAMYITQYVNSKEKDLIKGCKEYERKQQARKDSKDKWQFTCQKCGMIYKRARKPKYLEWGFEPSTMIINGAVCGGGCRGKLKITKYPQGGLDNVKFYL